MKIIKSVEAMQAESLHLRTQGISLGFVPTMGYLHRGHSSLMDLARGRADLLVASIFVNPTQFGPNEDLDAYPRDFERDERICREHAVDILFYPSAAEMYPADSSAYVVEEQLSQGLCGRSRPGHFRGVCTVVAKLLNIVQPAFIVLGEKDYQQLAVLRRMLRDLNFPVEVVAAPIVREDDGLALSSRNKYLSPGERAEALCLRRGLLLAERLYRGGLRDAARIRAAVAEEIAGSPAARIDYVELVDADTLAPLQEIEGPALLALAVYIGRTRLIDNIVLNRP